MIRGTTPIHTFTIPFDTSLLHKVKIVYAQDEIPIITKNIEDCTLNGFDIKVKLSQEDTLAFNCKKFVEIQIRVLTKHGEALTSLPMKESVERCLDDEVL